MVIFTPNSNMKVDIEDVRDFRVKEILSLQISKTWDNITKSQANEETFNLILEFIKRNTLSKAEGQGAELAHGLERNGGIEVVKCTL